MPDKRLRTRKPGEFRAPNPRDHGLGKGSHNDLSELDPNDTEKTTPDFDVIRKRPGRFWAPAI